MTDGQLRPWREAHTVATVTSALPVSRSSTKTRGHTSLRELNRNSTAFAPSTLPPQATPREKEIGVSRRGEAEFGDQPSPGSLTNV